MKTSMAKSSEDLPSKRHFHWTTKVRNQEEEEEEDEEPTALTLKATNTSHDDIGRKHKDEFAEPKVGAPAPARSSSQRRKQLQAIAVSRLRSAILTVLSKNRSQPSTLIPNLGTRVVGTLFGYRKGHVHFVFQKDATSRPAFVIELATPISGLVKEMASGLVRIALECDKEKEKKPVGREKRLLEETQWRTNCNGKKCGFATRRECGERDWKVLKAVEPISMGAGVLPATNEEKEGDGGEVMYMRAKFERVVGSRDSEAFYMMNPDCNGTPELSIYLLRV